MTLSKKPQYINKREKVIILDISEHARRRFLSRWKYAFPQKTLLPSDVDAEIAKWFKHSSRVFNLSEWDRKRLKKHGKDTIFFRINTFTFVVQGATIVTIELSDPGQRHLNKTSSVPPNETTESETIVASANTNKELNMQPFKITASAYDEDGRILFVNLGNYDSKCVNGSAEHLRNIPDFKEEVLKRFIEKRPSYTLCSVFVSFGNRGKSVTVFDIYNQPTGVQRENLHPSQGEGLAGIQGHVETKPKDNQCPYVKVFKTSSAESIVNGYFIPGMIWVIDPIELSRYT